MQKRTTFFSVKNFSINKKSVLFHDRMAAELLDHARNFRDPFKVDTFRIFVKTHQALLFPAFKMQLALQRKFLGTTFWESNANRRMEICNGKYISVGAFIAEVSEIKKLDLSTMIVFVYETGYFIITCDSTACSVAVSGSDAAT